MGHKKINVAIITGGDSLEASSSIDSAQSIFAHLNSKIFNRYMLKVESWHWSLMRADETDQVDPSNSKLDLSNFSLRIKRKTIRFDVAFIAIHGTPGETGHLQAYLEMMRIPYIGSGVLASAICMDKFCCKTLIQCLTNAQAPRGKLLELEKINNQKLQEAIPFRLPCIVKPNSYGSGVGVTLVNNSETLTEAVKRVCELGQDVLLEEYIDGREVTVGAIMINDQIQILPLAETLRENQAHLLQQANTYSYTNRQSATVIIDPPIDAELMIQLKNVTIEIGKVIKCRSFFRVDYIITKDNLVYFLEINTIPGMTDRSVFVKQMEHAGIDRQCFYHRLITETIAAA